MREPCFLSGAGTKQRGFAVLFPFWSKQSAQTSIFTLFPSILLESKDGAED